jgi:predicted nucleic acid-binding protein
VRIPVNGYLLDNNVISVLARPADSRRPVVIGRLNAVGESPVLLPVIAIAEIEFGLEKAEKPDLKQRSDLRAFLARYPHPLPVDRHTIEPYALIRAEIWRRHATPKKRGHKEKLPEQLTDRVTGKELGIDERDLLIASIAVQYRLTLATVDRNAGMMRIEEAAMALEERGSPIRLRVDDWSIPLT